jgi:hypothetical protein
MRWAALLAIGIVGGFTTCYAATADAGWQRIQGASCKALAPYFVASDTWSFGSFGLIWEGNGEAPYALATCPFDETSSFLKTSVNQVNVHGEDRSTTEGVRVQACISYWSSSGGECGLAYNSGDAFLGQFTGHPSLEKWGMSYANEFAYFVARMPARTASGNTSLHGFYILTP